MAIDLFKPTLWSNMLINNMDKALVFGNIVNRNVEGEIKKGNQLKILEIGDITVADYTSTSGVTYQTLGDASKTLVIDQDKYFAFEVDDADAVQSNVEVFGAATARAGFHMADTFDQYIAGLYTEAGVLDTTYLGSSSTGLKVNANDMVKVISDMARNLDEANCPRQDRFIVWDATLWQYLVVAEVVAGTNYPDSPNAPAYFGGLAPAVNGLGFTHYMSNNVNSDSSDKLVMFGHKSAIAAAVQIDKVEAIRRDAYFADGIRGRMVYGAKVVRPNRLGLARLYPGGVTS